ncbi:MAG: family 10 glycosylhydrolase [Phycisphaeraceae bacterium]|nr:MAG: family 10 glycosylhydrolase [Phycisphaeraceae bacterium]
MPRFWLAFATSVLLTNAGGLAAQAPPADEVRGTWLTTTANDAIASPARTNETMRRLREVGLNTVYVEVWKNGYTQYPSEVLRRVIGVDRRPALMKQDPSDSPGAVAAEGRDLLEETLIAAHREGLAYIAWFEYGFMAAHKDTDNHLRRMKPDWLSRDLKGNEIAPNGFVWMNPLHPEARRFLLDLVLEAVERYDLDGIQLDDRIVWPYITMGYDDCTRSVYAAEHEGRQPPDDHTDEAWRRWRADKINEYARQFVTEVRAARPGLIVSLSPAVYPWCYENYCLEWPKWAAWGTDAPSADDPSQSPPPRWDEFIPQCYRFNYPAFERTWLEQVSWMNRLGGGRVRDMLPGIRVVGEGADSTWDDLRKSIELARRTGAGGHVLWYSKGVFLYERELTDLYQSKDRGPAGHPKLPAGWRPRPLPMAPSKPLRDNETRGLRWGPKDGSIPAGDYRIIARRGDVWTQEGQIELGGGRPGHASVSLRAPADQVELLKDRRAESRRARER